MLTYVHKCYSSEGKGMLAVGSQEKPQSCTTQQTPHKRSVWQDTGRRVAASICARSSRELSRRQVIHGFLGRGGVGRAFQGGLGLVGILWSDLGTSSGIGGILCSGIGGILCLRLVWGGVKSGLECPFLGPFTLHTP